MDLLIHVELVTSYNRKNGVISRGNSLDRLMTNHIHKHVEESIGVRRRVLSTRRCQYNLYIQICG